MQIKKIQKEVYVLEMDAKEAKVLHTICGNLTGKVEGPRQVTDAIYAALAELGFASDSRLLKGSWELAGEFPLEASHV